MWALNSYVSPRTSSGEFSARNKTATPARKDAARRAGLTPTAERYHAARARHPPTTDGSQIQAARMNSHIVI